MDNKHSERYGLSGNAAALGVDVPVPQELKAKAEQITQFESIINRLQQLQDRMAEINYAVGEHLERISPRNLPDKKVDESKHDDKHFVGAAHKLLDVLDRIADRQWENLEHLRRIV